MLYSFSQLAVARKYDLASSWDTTKSVFRSSFFIFFHAYNGAIMGCALRAGFGRFYYRVLVCAPGLISSYFSILIEKPSRRQALAFYLLNMASEIVYRMLVTKGYFKPLKHGETILFAVSLATWYHIIKTEGFGHDPVSGAMKALIGRDEAKSRAKSTPALIMPALDGIKSQQGLAMSAAAAAGSDFKQYNDKQKMLAQCTNANSSTMTTTTTTTGGWFQAVYKILGQINPDLVPSKHECCPHRESSCLEYILSSLPNRFLIGYGIQTLLSLSKNPFALIQSPGQTIKRSLVAPSSVKFGLFLASLVGGGRATSCLLRHYSNGEHEWHSALAGFVAGLSMLWSPRSSISMYVMWKAIEQHYLIAARKGKVKYVDFTVQCIYSISAATILYTFALEPRFIRPSYMKFLDNVSDHRLHQLNRMVLDVFGTGSSVGYEDFFPDLDPKLMSNQFKELIFNWMIQPYE